MHTIHIQLWNRPQKRFLSLTSVAYVQPILHAHLSFCTAHAQIEKISADSGRLGACFYLSVIQLYDVKSAVTELLWYDVIIIDA